MSSRSNLASSSSSKGLISTVAGTTPFYTNATTNPWTINLNQSQCRNLTWYVNATGSSGANYTFFAYANKTSDLSIGNITDSWNVTIQGIESDTTPPLVTIITPVNGTNYNYSTSSVVLNISTNENASCLYSSDAGATNTSMTANASLTGFNYSLSVTNGSYTINFYCNDTSNNLNNSVYTIFSVNSTPRITMQLWTPANLSIIQNATQNQFFNVSTQVCCVDADCGEVNVSLDPSTISLNSSYDLADVRMEEGNFRFGEQIKWDVSSFAGQTISDSQLCIYAKSGTNYKYYPGCNYYVYPSTPGTGCTDACKSLFTVSTGTWISDTVCQDWSGSFVGSMGGSCADFSGAIDCATVTIDSDWYSCPAYVSSQTYAANCTCTVDNGGGCDQSPNYADYFNFSSPYFSGTMNDSLHLVTLWRINNETWQEDSFGEIPAEMPGAVLNETNVSIDLPLVLNNNFNTWTCMNVTTQIKECIINGASNCTIRWDATNMRGNNREFASTGDLGLELGIAGAYSPTVDTHIVYEDRENTKGSGKLPYLNITYEGLTCGTPCRELGGSFNKACCVVPYSIGFDNKSADGLVNTTVGATPFYTNQSNPRTINLNQSQCENVTFYVNATGSVGTNYTFFAFANMNSDESIGNVTDLWNVTILSGASGNLLSACGDLNNSDTTYTLTQNVSSAGTCFNITANNVTLDCNGYMINYSQSLTGYAIKSDLKNFSSVRNCKIEQGSNNKPNSYAIFLRRGQNATIENNNISTYGNSTNIGIYLSGFSKAVLQRNIISTTAASSYGIHSVDYSGFASNNYDISLNNVTTFGNSTHVIYLRNTDNASIYSNNITGYGTSGVWILALSGKQISGNNRVENNTIRSANSGNAIGIYLNAMTNSLISGNDIIIAAAAGINLYSNSSGNNVTSNTINSTKSGQGVKIDTYSNYNNIAYNTLLRGNYGIYLIGNSNYNNVSYNNFSDVIPLNYGLVISASHNNIFNSNRILASKINAIYLTNTAGNIFYDNYLNTSTAAPIGFARVDQLYPSYLNTSLQAGTNILGRELVGGNFWATAASTGYSQMCGDADDDGICDELYAPNSYNIDYHPLAVEDTTAPYLVEIYSPVNNSYVNGNVTIKANALDNVRIRHVLFQYKNSTVDWTNISGCDDYFANFTCLWNTALFSNSAEGYEIKAVAYDFRGNSAENYSNYVIDRSKPIINSLTVVYPDNQNSLRSSQIVTLRANVTDSPYNPSGIYSVLGTLNSLNGTGDVPLSFIDGSIAALQNSIWEINVTVTNTSSARVYSTISVYDNSTPTRNLATGQTWKIQLDNSAPTYSQLEYSGDAYNNSNIIFSVLAADNFNLSSYIFASNLSGVWENDSGGITGRLSIASLSKTVHTGEYSYYFILYDEAGNSNTTESAIISVGGDAPLTEVYLISPSDNNYTSNQAVNFTYSYTQQLVDNCSLYINDILNASMISPLNYTTLGFDTSLAEGSYSWQVKCYRNESEAGESVTKEYISEVRIITIDITNPLVQIVYPLNDTYTNQVTQLNYTIGDTNLQRCWYSTNLGVTNRTVACGTNISGLTAATGNRTWKIWTNDSAGNKNSSTVNFLVDYSGYSGCFNLTSENTVYTLTQNVSSAGTCFYVKANNVTLDCQGYMANYSIVSAGNAVRSDTYNSTVIRNCIFEQGGTSTSSYAVRITRGQNSTVYNNTINTYTSGSAGVYLSGVSNSSIFANRISSNSITEGATGIASDIYTSGTVYGLTNSISYNNITSRTNNSKAVVLYDTDYSNVSYNNVSHYGVWGAYGILLDRKFAAGNNRVENNSVSSISPRNWYTNYNIFIGNQPNVVVSGNTINSIYPGIYLGNVNFGTVSNNNINGRNSNVWGISTGTNITYTNISQNVISAVVGGISCGGSSNRIENNNISSMVASNTAAISPGSGNTITGNRIFASWRTLDLRSAIGSSIYNNYLNYSNGLAQLPTTDPIYVNRFNTSLQSGVNIINGSWIGGNFYSSAFGTGYGQTCIDVDVDGICDDLYPINVYNIDYHPLAVEDNVPPSVEIYSPVNDSYVNGKVELKAIVTDNVNIRHVLFQYKNSTVGWTNISGCDFYFAPFNFCNWSTTLFSNSTEGYDIQITAWDYRANSATNVSHYTIDRNKPVVNSLSVIYPTGQSSVRDSQTVALRANVTDSPSAAAGMYYVEANISKLNGTQRANMSLIGGSLAALQNSIWEINVSVNNGLSTLVYPGLWASDNSTPTRNVRTGDVWSVQIDNTAPTYSDMNHTPLNPANNSFVNFYLTAYDNFNLSSYIFASDLSGVWENTYRSISGTGSIVNVRKKVYSGDYSYYFILYDDAGNSNETIINSISVSGQSTPTTSIELISPDDGNYSISQAVNFTYSYTQQLVDNCSLYINDVLNASMISPLNYTTLGFDTSLAEGSYSWQVRCLRVEDELEGSVTKEYVSEIRYLVVDVTTPLVQIVYPLATTYSSVSELNYTINDANLDSCSYSLDLGITNTSISCGTNITGLTASAGSNTWKIYVNDSAGHTNSSSVTFTIQAADTTLPLIQFVSPTLADNNLTDATSAYVNVSSSDNLGEHSVISDWNRSLVTWLRMNDNNLNDSSSWGNNATIIMGTNYTTGRFGGGYRFSGCDYGVECPQRGYINLSTNFNSSQPFTVSVWVNPTNITWYAWLIGNRNNWEGSDPGFSLFLWPGTYAFSIVNETQAYVTRDDSSPEILNRWTLVTGVWNGSTALLYLDGVLKDSTIISGHILEDYGDLWMGTQGSGNGNFNGTMDDLQIYTRALSSQEVKAIYNATSDQYYNNFTSLAAGNYTYKAYAQDAAGNVNNTELRNLQIVAAADTTPPVISVISPEDGWVYDTTNDVWVNFTATDSSGISSMVYWNGTVNLTYTSPILLENLSNGDYEFVFYANDTNGNSNSVTVVFAVDYTPAQDTTPPTVTLSYPSNGASGTNMDWNFGCNISDNDAVSSLTIYVWDASSNALVYSNTKSVSGTSDSETWSHTFDGVGNYIWNCKGVDGVGLTDWDSNRTFSITSGSGGPDTTPPVVSLISPVEWYNSTSQLIDFSCGITDNIQVANLTLFIWNSTGSQVYTDTKTLTGVDNSSSWNYNLPYTDLFIWNCLGYDNSTNLDWGNNRTLNISVINGDLLEDRWNSIIAPEGVFEPYAVLSGTHVSNFSIRLTNLTISSAETLSCSIKTPSSNFDVEETGLSMTNRNYTLNYTVQAGDDIVNDAASGYLPWIVKSCKIENSSGLVAYQNTSQRIYVHDASYWEDDEVTRAVACQGTPLVYFNNTGKCNYNDTLFALQMRNGNSVNATCFNNPGLACAARYGYCKAIFFKTCAPTDYFAGYNADTDDPNGYATFTASFAGYNTPIAYTRYTKSDTGTFKLRLTQALTSKTYSITIYNLTNVESANVYGSSIGSGTTAVTDNGDGTYNVAYNQLSTAFTGTLDLVFNVSFTSSLDEDRILKLVIAYGTSTNQDSPELFTEIFSPTSGLNNDNESQTSSITTDGSVCGDRVNNDFDYYSSWATSYDCYDEDCDNLQGDPSQTNDLGSGKTGLCNYGTERNCSDEFDNDYDNKVDCGDLDCNNSIGSADGSLCNYQYETVCNDNFNNDQLQLKDCELSAVASSKTMPTVSNAEYDCAGYCRTGTNIEITCDDNIDNDYDAVVVTSPTAGTANTSEGAGIDCRWGGYYSVGSSYNPDEDCDGILMTAGRCELANEASCDDGFDNDFDKDASNMPHANWSKDSQSYYDYFGRAYVEDADYDDYDCVSGANRPVSESLNASWCFDGIDNNLDSYYFNGTAYVRNSSTGVDCADPSCMNVANPEDPLEMCLSQEYNATSAFFQSLSFPGFYCNNSIDDDADAYTDCYDSDCNKQFGFCSAGPCYDTENITWRSCADNLDNDYDSSRDCAESECSGMIGSLSGALCGAEVCNDGFDNNRNGLTDCQDSSCAGSLGRENNGVVASCQLAETSCSDSYDNDGDSAIDCYDSDCNSYCSL